MLEEKQKSSVGNKTSILILLQVFSFTVSTVIPEKIESVLSSREKDLRYIS